MTETPWRQLFIHKCLCRFSVRIIPSCWGLEATVTHCLLGHLCHYRRYSAAPGLAANTSLPLSQVVLYFSSFFFIFVSHYNLLHQRHSFMHVHKHTLGHSRRAAVSAAAGEIYRAFSLYGGVLYESSDTCSQLLTLSALFISLCFSFW